MKRIWSVMILMALWLGLFLPAAQAGETPGQPMLISCYVQFAWGEDCRIAAVDRDGRLWTYTGGYPGDLPDNDLQLPEWVEGNPLFTLEGTLKDGRLNDLRSLIACAEQQEVTPQPVACDAGVWSGMAFRLGAQGMECVVLGMAGDERYENTDPSAQSLCLFLRQTFPGVRSFMDDPMVSPAGFRPQPLMDFCGYGELFPWGMTVTEAELDCETGWSEERVSNLDPAVFSRMTVTGKRNAMSVTGNITEYRLVDDDGCAAASFSFYHGLLVMPDGMYTVEGSPF